MKKIALFLALTLTAALLFGCSSKGPATFKEADPDQYLTLGEYKGLTYTKADTSVSEYQLQVALNKLLYDAGYGTLSDKKITKGKVQIGDTANIDYKGVKDGVAFEGGTAQGQDLNIGSGSFIAGFEEGLVGVEVGETVDLDLTFPENYGNAELAGQAVVFTVKVNYIKDRTTYPELTDDLVVKLKKEAKTKKELIENTKKELLASNEQEALSTAQNTLWTKVMTATTFKGELPSTLLDSAKKEYNDYYKSIALQYGYDDVDSFLAANNLSSETIAQQAEALVKQQLTAYAIAKAEGYTISEKEFDTYAKSFATAAGYENVEEYLKLATRERVEDQIILDYALNLIVEKAK
ncbi:MAG: trigger factor [Clostridia bacterium]|nr:trigger factor [Clostridia bacterium]